MFWMALPLFGTYALILWTRELVFRRRRSPGAAERFWTAAETTTLVLAVAVTLFVEYEDETKVFYAVPAALSTLLVLRNSFALAPLGGRGEHLAHAMTCMLHVGVLAAAMVIWNFIDGAGLFLGIVLPFSARDLRPLAQGHLAVIGALVLYQAIAWARAHRAERRRTDGQEVVALPAPEEASPLEKAG